MQIINILKFKYLLYLVAVVSSFSFNSASFGQNITSEKNQSSLFLAPQYLSLYSKDPEKLSEQEQWRIKIHGLRIASLHPIVWSVKKSERTENRRLIAIRPYYLRASEDPDFIFDEFRIKFVFKKVSKEEASRDYHDKDSVLDIGFNGQFIEGPPLTRALKDDSYVIRLTPFDDFKSGLFFRSYNKHILQKEMQNTYLETATPYDFRILFTKDNVIAELNGIQVLNIENKNLNSGLFYLTTSWNPVHITDLKIKGHYKDRESVTLSGLFSIPGQKKFK